MTSLTSQMRDALDPEIRVMCYMCGNGKTFYSKEVTPDIVRRQAAQVELQNDGIRTMEMIQMRRSKYEALKIDQILIIEIGRDGKPA